MLALVRIALQRPYTFVVLAILILITGVLAAMRTPTDIFPNIKIPVIGVAWTFTGLSPEDTADRLMSVYERVLPTTVNDIQHMDSTSMTGMGIVKIYFQPNVDIRTATAQVTSISQSILRQMPTGVQPPLILNYNAATVPIIQLAASSPTQSEQQVFDASQYVIRPALSTVAGAAIPFPFGGKVRQVQIDLDPVALQSKSLSAQDVTNAITARNQITPVGQVKVGGLQYDVRLNDAVPDIAALNEVPVKTVNGGVVRIGDIGHVRDGFPPQQNIVHVDGGRAVLTTILKTGNTSMLSIIENIKARLPAIQQLLPPDFKVVRLNDQSLFVNAAISGVVREGVIAAALTSLMILLFLGSWRSTVIIATTIPLSVLCAVVALSAIGETFNIMTLGGLALAVGILVDQATVTIENINLHLEHGAAVEPAILDGARQVLMPGFVSLLCICVVFVPMFLIGGVAGYLFVPMAEAVVFAIVGSFILSATLVPTMAKFLLRANRREAHAPETGAPPPRSPNPLVNFQRAFQARFEQARDGHRALLGRALAQPRRFIVTFLGVVAVSFGLAPFLGENFFPSVDSGQMLLHVHPPMGTRIEDASSEFGFIEAAIRRVIPPTELSSIVDNIGLPISSINTVYNNTGQSGFGDGDIYVSLNSKHHPTAEYMRRLREVLPRAFSGSTFSFPPADIVSQILNFGAPAPIDVKVTGPDLVSNHDYAASLLAGLRRVPGIADVHIRQSLALPQLRLDMDRVRMNQLGLTESDVTGSLGTTIAGDSQSQPTFWLDPKSRVSYPIVVQAPEYRLASLPDLASVPVSDAGAGHAGIQPLGGLGKITRAATSELVSHYDIQPNVDIYATTQDRDLGAVAADVQQVIAAHAAAKPRGVTVALDGQAPTMQAAFSGLFFGLLGAIVLIYLLIVVNFQSWTDPFIIVTALPAALAGIVWMLFATGTTLSVPALTGAIMCMGVATANSILVVSFARERLAETGDPVRAALEAGYTRARPVVMTALAMIIGMLPMALGLGEGGEQNAPLGRAVVGGLVCATVATLFFVPVVFAVVHGRKAAPTTDPATDAPLPDLGEAHA